MEALVHSGRWQRLHYGVYASFTGAPPRGAVLWAAVLRAGPQSILSHETAAELDGLVDKPSTLLHVTIPQSQRVRPIDGIAIHRSTRILEARGPWLLPPRTMIEETVLDLTQHAVSFDAVISLLARACQRRLTLPELLRQRVEMRGRMRWHAEILQALEDVADGVHSPLEYRYLRDVQRAHGLPAAKRQVRAVQGGRGIFRDVCYVQFGVVIELDGKASHADRRLQDNRRDNAAAARGLITLRYGWADVTERSCKTALEVGQTLHTRGWPGPLRNCRRCNLGDLGLKRVK
jgi:very-short-patch-repair endonuclease